MWSRDSLSIPLAKSNFKILGKICKEAMDNIKVKNLPVMAAEDKTAIISQVSYSEATDELLGFCGISGPDHKCIDKFTIVVGNGEQGYHTIVNSFNNCKIGAFAQAIVLNPLHPTYLGLLCLPCLPATSSTRNFCSTSGKKLNACMSRNLRVLLDH